MPLPLAEQAIHGGMLCVAEAERRLFQGLKRAEMDWALDTLHTIGHRNNSPIPAIVEIDHTEAIKIYRPAHFLLRRCIQLMTVYVADGLQTLPVSSGLQLLVLYIVAACEPVEQARISRILWVDKSSLSLVLALLEKEELICREPDPRDGRQLLSKITASGMKFLEIGFMRGRNVDKNLLEPLSAEDRERFVTIFYGIVSRHGESDLAT